MYAYTAADFYTKMTYDCTVAFLSVTVCINYVIPSAKHSEMQRGRNIEYNKKIFRAMTMAMHGNVKDVT